MGLNEISFDVSHSIEGFFRAKIASSSSQLDWKASWINLRVRAVWILAAVVNGGLKCNGNTVSCPISHGSSIINWKKKMQIIFKN